MMAYSVLSPNPFYTLLIFVTPSCYSNCTKGCFSDKMDLISKVATFFCATKTHFIKTLLKPDMKIILKSLKLKKALTSLPWVPLLMAAAKLKSMIKLAKIFLCK